MNSIKWCLDAKKNDQLHFLFFVLTMIEDKKHICFIYLICIYWSEF